MWIQFVNTLWLQTNHHQTFINVPWSLTTVVSHGHQKMLWSQSNPSTSVPLIQRFQIQMVTNDHTTELQIIPHYPAGDDSNNTTVKTSQMDRPQSRTRPIRRSGQMSKGGFSTNLKSQRIRHGSCILPSRKLSIQKSIETKWSWMTIDDYLQGPTWPFKTVWVNHWSQIQMVRYGRDGLNNDLTNVRNEHPFKPSHFNPSFRFLPCRT